MRRFPAPWTVEALDGGFKVVDANGQTLAYAYGHATRAEGKNGHDANGPLCRLMTQSGH
jgi:hypothetical protein